MPSIETAKRALRVLSDSMYDPADAYGSCMVDDVVIVDADKEAKDGDFVIVSFDGNESLMKSTIQEGVRFFRYTAPDRSDFCLTDADAVITGVVTARQRYFMTDMTGPLKWQGDNIGFCNDSPIRINLADRDGCSRTVFLREALLAADEIDGSGMQRITSALSFAAERGYLRPMDLDVWNEFKSNREINEAGEACHA
jgi:hypothetical protein